jgi:NADH-quinone oxidoreductase subunit L
MPHIFGVTNYFENWLEPVISSTKPAVATHMLTSSGGDTAMELFLMFSTVALVGLAIYAAFRIYNKRPEIADSLANKFKAPYNTLLNKYYVDEFYGAVVVRPLVYFSVFLWKIMDVLVIDGLLNGLAKLYEGISETMRSVQTGRVRSYATVFVIGVLLLIAYAVIE